MCTPPQKDGTPGPNIIAAKLQALTESFLWAVHRLLRLLHRTEVYLVDKIVGPGNIFVATARKTSLRYSNIDMITGPSEILIIADSSANPKFLAADLMSQAEHDKLASSILLTDSAEIAEKTKQELALQMENLSRKDIIESSLDNFGAIIVCSDMSQAIEFANELDPEHLEVCCNNPMEYIGKLDNAGSVFLGNYSPETLGDYFAGLTTFFPQAERLGFLSLFLLTALSRSQASSIIQRALRMMQKT